MKKIFIIIIFAILFLPRVVFAQEERTILPDYSWYGTGVKTNQIKNPETANDIYKTLFVLMICLSSTLLLKKIQHNN